MEKGLNKLGDEKNKNIGTKAKSGDTYLQSITRSLYGGDQRQALQFTRNALLSSIFFVQLHFDFEIRTDSDSDDLQNAMQKWGKRLSKSKQGELAVLPASTEFALEVYNYVEEKGAARLGDDTFSAITDQLESVVHVESYRGMNVPFSVPGQISEVRGALCVHTARARQPSTWRGRANAIINARCRLVVAQKTVGPAWTWIYLRHLFNSPVSPCRSFARRSAARTLTETRRTDGCCCAQDELSRALNEMVDMLRVHNTERRLLCLLQMLTEIIHSYPALPTDPLRRLIVALDPFYCWPCPFGPLAQRLIATAERELASPGAAVRQGYLLECPSLAVASGESLSDLYRPAIPVYFDPSTTNARFLQLSLTTPAAKPATSPRSSEHSGGSEIAAGVADAAAKMLLHILQRAGAQVLELPPDAATVLSTRHPDDLVVL